jgi:hypothetical protein
MTNVIIGAMKLPFGFLSATSHTRFCTLQGREASCAASSRGAGRNIAPCQTAAVAAGLLVVVLRPDLADQIDSNAIGEMSSRLRIVSRLRKYMRGLSVMRVEKYVRPTINSGRHWSE